MRKRINKPHNKGGPRTKIKELYLPKWTEDLPEHTLITTRDLMTYNNVCRETMNKNLPAPSVIRPSGPYHGKKHFWYLKVLRKILKVSDE